MAVPITLNDLANLDNGPTAVATINANNAAITAAFNEALDQAGDSMSGQLDMQGRQIINLPSPSTLTSPVRLADITNPSVSITVPPTGTSGATVPYLNGINTWSGTQDFTGSTVTVTTQTASNNSTKAASTAYVDAAVAASGGGSLPGLSVLGRAGTTTGAGAAITGAANQFLGVNSAATALAFETMSGDATLGSGALTLATVNSGPGSVGSSTAIPVITTNGKGLVTAQTTAAVVAPAGTLTGTTLASNVVTSSLTSHAKDIQHGADAASSATSSIQAQSIVAGTNNQSAGNFSINGAKGTGTGAGGSVIIQTAPAGTTGTAQNSLAAGLTVTAPVATMQPSVLIGNQAIATTATDGFLYIPTCAGAPTGVPTTQTGRVALVWDTTNHKFWVYDTAWKGGTAPGVWS